MPRFAVEGADAERLRAIIQADPLLTQALSRLRDLDLPDGWIVSGAIYQTVWNVLGDLPPATGLKDIDLIYFDGSDLSWEAEDRVIQAASPVFADLSVPVEIRNQARVHLWFERRFGTPYKPLSHSLESLTRYAAVAHAVAVRLTRSDGIEIAAPFGLGDIFGRVLRPNPGGDRNIEAFIAKAKRMQATWPEIRIDPEIRSV